MERLGSWVLYFVSSAIVATTLVDDFALGGNSGIGNKIDIIFGISCATLALSLFFIISHATCAGKVLGGYIELGLTIVSSALWVLAILYVVDPNNALAIGIIVSQYVGIFKEGQELILNANLFFFSWIAFLSSIYISVSLIREKLKIEDGSMNQWLLVLTSGIVLLGNINSIDVACNSDDGDSNTCHRTKLAIGVGSVGILMSLIVVIMAAFKKTGGMVQLVVNMITVAVYLAGTALLTSASGPAKVMGNTYFAVWGGFGVSTKLFHDLVSKKFLTGRALAGAKISDSEAV